MIRFTVIGEPAPKGSSRAMLIGGRARNVPSGSNVNRDKLRSWGSNVTAAAVEAMQGRAPFVGQALSIAVVFRFARLASHFRKSGDTKASAPTFHSVKPDADKLLRATCDSLSGIAFDDDSRIAVVSVEKRYAARGEAPGADIVIGVVTS